MVDGKARGTILEPPVFTGCSAGGGEIIALEPCPAPAYVKTAHIASVTEGRGADRRPDGPGGRRRSWRDTFGRREAMAFYVNEDGPTSKAIIHHSTMIACSFNCDMVSLE